MCGTGQNRSAERVGTDVGVIAGIDNDSLSRGLAYSDIDKDGDLDFYTVVIQDGGITTHGAGLFFRNDLNNQNHYLQLRLQGVLANRDAVGAHIQVSVGSESWIREITGGSSFCSQNSSVAHFGLGSATQVDTVKITWPGGNTQYLYNVQADTCMLIVEDTGAVGINPYLLAQKSAEIWPNPFSNQINIRLPDNSGSNVEIQILDVNGRTLMSYDYARQSGDVIVLGESNYPLPNLRGMYFLQISDGRAIYRSKIIKYQ